MMHPIKQAEHILTRRQFLGRTATGIGTAALARLLARDGLQAATPPGLP
jgi:hypothetical protein